MKRTAPVFLAAEAVEDAFYRALRNGDLTAVMALWAEDDDVVCVHPNGSRLVGLAAVRSSWEAILRNGPVQVQVRERQVITGAAITVHNVIEEITVDGTGGPQVVHCVATNAFARDAGGWRLVLHHAAAVQGAVTTTSTTTGEVLH